MVSNGSMSLLLASLSVLCGVRLEADRSEKRESARLSRERENCDVGPTGRAGMPLVSLGPSGIGGEYQREVG